MSETSALINILGAVALLLWGLRMVSTGIARNFGTELRHGIAISAGNRGKSLLAGMLVTIALQSSTATCLMAASFAGRGLITTATTLAIMLGADIGTSVVAKLLTFNVGPLSALLVLVGFVLFRSSEGRARHLARILIGLGLMLLSLRLLNVASEPLRNSAQMRMVLYALDGSWLIGMALAAGIAMLAHSSIATILLILPLATAGDFSLSFGLALILGANLGSALPPVLETVQGKPGGAPAGRSATPSCGLIGCVVALPFLNYAAELLPLVEAEARSAARRRPHFVQLPAGGGVPAADRRCGAAGRTAAAGRSGCRKSGAGEVSRRGRAFHAGDRHCRCRPRDAADRRCRREHAAALPGTAGDQQSQPGGGYLRDGQHRGCAARGGEALSGAAGERGPDRRRAPARLRRHDLRHQSRARRRHHRSQPEGAGQPRRSSAS